MGFLFPLWRAFVSLTCLYYTTVSFDSSASRYHSAVYNRKRLELLSKLNTSLHPFYLTQLKSLHKTLLRDFRKAVQEGLRTEGYDFGLVVSESTRIAQAGFKSAAQEGKLGETDWDWEESAGMLREDMEGVAQVLRGEEIKKTIVIIEVRATLLYGL